MVGVRVGGGSGGRGTRLLEEQRATLCHGALDDVVNEVDGLTVQVLRVE